MNSTLAAPLSEIAHYYLTQVDVSSLNIFEKAWMSWYMWWDNPVLATGLMSFIMHEVVYFGRCVPWIIIDAMPYFRRWKLQPTKVPTAKDQWECTKLVLFSHFTVELPQIWLFHPIAEYLGMATYQLPFPGWKTMAWQIALFFMFEDAFHFVAHQALHYGPLYRNIHKIHHKYSAPFGLAAEYAHPAEVLILGTGTIGGPLLYCWFTRDLHIFTMYAWIVLRLFQAVDSHSGYDFPWSLNKFFPLWSGADHHDFHHMAFTNNYSTSFRYLDHIFGTDKKYHAYKARLRAAAAKDREALNQKLMAETEKEGQEAERIAEQSGYFGSKIAAKVQ
ncbi:hypothetical protein DACRYDRAFT_24694 [Dacryopinax primogenitus]|uniref:Fatty acid hydroxylase domain-containing protein n=1 Tax=Dacryopinax primogenitus (strain DJM 731) TaxID=1858805 RepID=M5FRE3_DACPD|nr:uncharacterized protein DACRYDRAFT_24694 [Dacryopinax primogenitus]EJT98218.1 hypothetical protein DACRYDRAFT_24694 [Dacryopinax primogenitus]